MARRWWSAATWVLALCACAKDGPGFYGSITLAGSRGTATAASVDDNGRDALLRQVSAALSDPRAARRETRVCEPLDVSLGRAQRRIPPAAMALRPDESPVGVGRDDGQRQRDGGSAGLGNLDAESGFHRATGAGRGHDQRHRD